MQFPQPQQAENIRKNMISQNGIEHMGKNPSRLHTTGNYDIVDHFCTFGLPDLTWSHGDRCTVPLQFALILAHLHARKNTVVDYDSLDT